jgi:hypothetical protein
VRRFLRDNGLTLAFAALCLLTVLGEALAGWRSFNEDQLAHHEHAISFGRFLYTSDFAEAISENWQSEFLQFSMFIYATIWLVQKGSAESKAPGEIGRETDEQQQVGDGAGSNSPRWARVEDWRTWVYSHSLLLVMTFFFFFSWGAQAVSGWSLYNQDQQEHKEGAVGFTTYLVRPDFWEKTMQNWQSEFMAVATMAIFTVYFRERGSPESKPVGAPHAETGTSG